MIVMCLLPTMRQMKDVICRYGCRTHILVDRDYGEFKWFLVLLKWVHRPLRNGAKEMENNESYVQLAGVERKTMNWFGGHALANNPHTASFPTLWLMFWLSGDQRELAHRRNSYDYAFLLTLFLFFCAFMLTMSTINFGLGGGNRIKESACYRLCHIMFISSFLLPTWTVIFCSIVWLSNYLLWKWWLRFSLLACHLSLIVSGGNQFNSKSNTDRCRKNGTKQNNEDFKT